MRASITAQGNEHFVSSRSFEPFPQYPLIQSLFNIQETYIEIQTEHLPQLLLRMVGALTCHLQALGLGELTHCLRLCSKILSKVQPPLVSPLALPSSTQGQNLSGSTSNPSNSAREASKEKGDNQVSKTIACIKKTNCCGSAKL